MGNALNRHDLERLPDHIVRFTATDSSDSTAQMWWRIVSETHRSEKDGDSAAEELVLTESKNFDKVGSICFGTQRRSKQYAFRFNCA